MSCSAARPGSNSNNCQSCHSVPILGGAGDFTANAFISEGFESADFDTLDPQFSDERGSVSLFGDGLIELLGREMTAELRAERNKAVAAARASGKPETVSLSSKGVDFGKLTVMPDGLVDFSALEGIDSDLTVRPFSQKGVFASLRQFTVNAGNIHLGLEAAERWGKRWTGTADFDGDGVPDELSPGDVSALVAFQATLPAPGSHGARQSGLARCRRPWRKGVRRDGLRGVPQALSASRQPHLHRPGAL